MQETSQTLLLYIHSSVITPNQVTSGYGYTVSIRVLLK